MLNVLIADDDRNFVDILGKKINEDTSYNLVAKLFDGQSTLALIEKTHPDVIILDIIMPEFDGIYIIDQIRRKMSSYRPIIYILSGMGTTNIINTLNVLDIDYFSLKPVSIDIVMHNLHNIVTDRYNDSVAPGERTTSFPDVNFSLSNQEVVHSLSKQLGILPHRKSTQCLNNAIIYCLQNSNGTQQITKVLYPEIAKQSGLTTSAIERNIRQAIASIQKAQTPLFEKVFAYANNKKITNGEFLAVITDYLMMQTSISRYH